MPTIRRLSPPSPKASLPVERSTPQERGYTSRWRRYSEAYRRRHPFCMLCWENGRMVFCDVVDHKYPVSDGGPMFPGDAGVWGLCISHHSGWKAALENYARSTGQMDRIVEWCDNPKARPRVTGMV